MSSKHRKSLTPWVTCEKCSSILPLKDMEKHDSGCPPSSNEWSHNYIKDKFLYSRIETYVPKELPKHMTEITAQDYIFMSESAMQLCEIAIGSYIIIKYKEHTFNKEAFPTMEKTLTNVFLTERAMKMYNISNGDLVTIENFTGKPLEAKEIFIKYIGKKIPPNLNSQIDTRKHFAIGQLLTIGNRISIPYYGQDVKLQIVEVIPKNDGRTLNENNSDSISEDFIHMNLSDDSPKFFKPDFSTKWRFVNEMNEIAGLESIEHKITLQDIGGYQEALEELKDEFDIILDDNDIFTKHRIGKGVLIHGTSGVGKSAILMALLTIYNIKIFKIESRDIFNRPRDEGIKKLEQIFNDAKSQIPSAIIIENIDKLFGKRSNNDNLTTVLLHEIDSLYNSNLKCLLLATTTKLDAIDPELRCSGRFDSEYNISVPTPKMRGEILEKMLTKLPHTINDDELNQISYITHGFVAADLYRLCSQAAKVALVRRKPISRNNDEKLRCVEVTINDFRRALKKVKPSAMKEVLVEVPNVKWTDIGGQKSLKMQLKQAIEWPLKYSETFSRLGISPPRGVLMFGPPGCSKTMVARALATESKLNFINIKGSDIYSMWVGESEKAVTEIFRKAQQVAPSIVFIDEIDALGSERATGEAASAGNQVQERVLTQLLIELDGVTALEDVTVVAATNRPDRIDKALLRPGRLDRVIYVPLPDIETRREIFKIQFSKMPVADDINITDLVEATEGFSGAEVQAVCREAALSAMVDDRHAIKVTKTNFDKALKNMSPGTPTSLLKLYTEFINKRL